MPVDDPWYPWQDNSHYDPHPPRGARVGVPAPVAHGFNLLGLPGDGSPASRFVRVFFQRQYALLAAPPADLDGALVLGQELLNTVYKVLISPHLPCISRVSSVYLPCISRVSPLLNTVYKVLGSIASSSAEDPLETTPLAMLAVPARRVVYHRGRADLTWRKIELARLDFRPRPGPRRRARVAASEFYAIDVTSFLLEEEEEDPGVRWARADGFPSPVGDVVAGCK